MIIDADVRAYANEHGLPYFRSGIVEHGGGGGPILEAMYTRPASRTHARCSTPAMRDRLWAFTIQGEDLPQATNRIDLDPRVRDVHGFPAGRATYDVHPHEVVASRYYAPKLEAIMREAGAEWTFAATSPPLEGDRAGTRGASISRHIMGTCRMGDDPRTSVVDRWQRFHDVENMVCTDSSVFPTSTGYGPTLTIVALAIRACREPRRPAGVGDARGPPRLGPHGSRRALRRRARRLERDARTGSATSGTRPPMVLVFLRHFG